MSQHKGARLRGERLQHGPLKGHVKGKPTEIRIVQFLFVASDPGRANGQVRTLSDMTPEEKAELEKRYGAKIK